MNKKIWLIGLCAVMLAVSLWTAMKKPAAEPENPQEDEKNGTELVVQKEETTQIRYISFGTGEKTMVIVPGLSTGYVTDSAQAVADGFAAFTEDYTVYLFDVREEVPEGYTIEEMGNDLASVMISLGLHDVYLYGCSMGGMESLYIAGTYPKLVKKLTVVSSACEENAVLNETIGNWVKLAEENKRTELTLDMGQKIYTTALFEAYREVFEGMGEGLDETMLTRFTRLATAIRNLNLTETAGKITCPVLVIGSEGDQVLSGDASVRIAEVTKGELVMYPEDSSHAIYDEIAEVKEKAKEFFDK
ncbi:MAG: alpha/beta hydrolase [Erysipelotrichaceae bacterium]|nr:alpha/beta hydrolase [Erysipelotrichaceae bacterium]